jgi:RNA polymerase sigma-70 factor (ECF subfamily)
MLEDLPDAELVARHLDGDPAAFGVLVARHRDRAWSVAMRTLGDPTEAADAVQDAFLSAFRSAAGFRAEAKFTTWLHRIVVNACVDRIRRRRPTVSLDEAVADTLADPRDPAAGVEASGDVAAALLRINPDQRAAIVLVDVHGFSVAEAAEVLGVAEGTVKSRCSRGRAHLALLLGHLRPRPGTAAPTVASEPRRPTTIEEVE